MMVNLGKAKLKENRRYGRSGSKHADNTRLTPRSADEALL